MPAPPSSRIFSRADLLARGYSPRGITAAVRAGSLVRIRRDRYARPGVDDPTRVATRVGGRLACVSALRDLGVFALEPVAPHIHLPHNHSRARSPRSRRVRLTEWNRDGVVLHWRPLSRAPEPHRVSIIDALRQVLLCQPPEFAIASIDSALSLALVGPAQLDAVFAGMPLAQLSLRSRLNGRSESGQESVLRCAFEDAGLAFEIQVKIAGVGRVDFVVEGVLVVEADSRLAHAKWSQQVRDRDRDLELARRGIPTLRTHYTVIMTDPQSIVDAVLAMLSSIR